MLDQIAESPKSVSGAPAGLWDFISNDTEIDRDICKTVIYMMLFGLGLVKYAIKRGLDVDDIVRIRMAFDQYTHEHKEL